MTQQWPGDFPQYPYPQQTQFVFDRYEQAIADLNRRLAALETWKRTHFMRFGPSPEERRRQQEGAKKALERAMERKRAEKGSGPPRDPDIQPPPPPPQPPPPEPEDFRTSIRDLMSERKWTITKTAELLGCDRPTLSRMLTGHSGLSFKMALGLERLGLGSAKHWLTLQMESGLAQARKEGHHEQ